MMVTSPARCVDIMLVSDVEKIEKDLAGVVCGMQKKY